MIIYGTNFYGRVDEVPGIFHVVTEFEHLYAFPLIPRKSFLVLDEEPGGARVVRIPLSWKSVFVAWLRAVLCLVGAFPLIVGTLLFLFLGPGHEDWTKGLLDYGLFLLVCTPGVDLLYLSYRVPSWSVASYERAKVLAGPPRCVTSAGHQHRSQVRTDHARGGRRGPRPGDASGVRQQVLRGRHASSTAAGTGKPYVHDTSTLGTRPSTRRRKSLQ